MPTRIGVFVAGLLKLLVQFTAILPSFETFNNQCQNISCTQTDLQARKTENNNSIRLRDKGHAGIFPNSNIVDCRAKKTPNIEYTEL